MSRVRLFISYCHEDRGWLARVSEHLAVLQRRELVEIWADTRIGIGAEWEAEIERALLASRLALLLVSPGFMASEFIWKKEMAHIVRHSTCGMDILPLIVRPCAWKLEPTLEKLQARPVDGRPLSINSDPQIDLDLTTLVYEIAGRLQAVSSSLAASEATRTFGREALDRAPRGERRSAGSINSQHAEASDSNDERHVLASLSREWTGFYNGDRPMKLVIRKRSGALFQGSIEYPNERSVTKIEGEIKPATDSPDNWVEVSRDPAAVRLIFREVGYERKGIREISFDGEYRVALSNGKLTGAWFSGARRVGQLELKASLDRRRR